MKQAANDSEERIRRSARINFELVRINLGNRDSNKLNARMDYLTWDEISY